MPSSKLPTTSAPAEGHRLALQSADGASITVSLHGGQVCTWRGADGTERLFFSTRAKQDGRTALRGGVPIIFPQFADHGSQARHGFARMLAWNLLESALQPDGTGLMRLVLTESDSTASLKGKFRLEASYRFSDTTLSIGLGIENTGDNLITFTTALHTYLHTDITRSAVSGLGGRTYLDSSDQSTRKIDAQPLLHIDREIDRIYPALDTPVTIRKLDSTIQISQTGFPDVVVWNPWRDKAALLSDLAPEEYADFVCVEAAQVVRPISLAAGKCWYGTQLIHIKPAVAL